MGFKNLWVERLEKYILLPLDAHIDPSIARQRIAEGYKLYSVDLTDDDLSEILRDQKGSWADLFSYVKGAGKMSVYG